MLCRDDTPMVRRAAAANLAKLVKVVEHEVVKPEVIQAAMLLLI